LAGNGYWVDWVSHSRPDASNAMFIGFEIVGSDATKST